MNRFYPIVGCLGGLGLSLLVAGCTNETEGDRALERESMRTNGAAMIKQGEQKVDQGKAMMARGQSMKDHGDNSGGEETMHRGQIMIDEGNTTIQHGRDLSNK